MACRKIGQVARQLWVSPRRVIEYERAGLVRPRREPSTGDRLFDDDDVEQLRRIRRFLERRGLTLAALRTLLAYAPCWELTGCPERTTCAVPRDPFTPCYRQRAAGIAIACERDCSRCPIFGSKEAACEALVVPFRAPPTGAPGAASSAPHAPLCHAAGGVVRPDAIASGCECVRTGM